VLEPDATNAPQSGARRCKSCGEPLPHRKRVYCDGCFAIYQSQLAGMRRPCRRCGQPVPNRKRVYCDPCLQVVRSSTSKADRSGS
jgi:hypothetical protein